MIGQTVGQYEVTAKIGEGGMGTVFEAVDKSIGKHVAIKVLLKDHAKNAQIASRFINEARAINVVDHPGVVQVSAFGTLPDGTAYIVMELLKGETLNGRMKASGGRMPMLSALSLARQIASALAAAHAKGIIHRDLKPDNVMIVADSSFPGGERTKLLDFGIAKLKLEYQGSGDQVMTRAGVMMGTPLYMSPEQCRNASDVDDKADVYSLGVMLYRMLAGKPPFSAPGTGELMAMHIYMQPPPLNEADRALPDTLVQLVHRMLAKKREERPSMSQVASELERIGAKHTGMMAAVPAPQPQGQSANHAAMNSNESATVLSDTGKPYIPAPPPAASQPPKRRSVAAPLILGLLLVGGGGFAVYRFLLQPASGPPPKSKLLPKDPNAGTTKPPPPTKPSTINWRIESDPAGAEIYRLDKNERLGTTPLRSQQPAEPGQIDLELRLKGYQPLKLTLSGSADEEHTGLKLEAEKAPRKRDKKKKTPAPAPAP